MTGPGHQVEDVLPRGGQVGADGEVFGVLEEALAGGILALRRILTRQLTTMTQENRGLPAQELELAEADAQEARPTTPVLEPRHRDDGHLGLGVWPGVQAD